MNPRNLLMSAARTALKLSCTGLEMSDWSFTRYAMYEAIQKAFEGRTIDGKVLSISHSKHLARICGATDEANPMVGANYPEQNILKLDQHPDNEYALVVSDQVFEHIEGDPQQAMNESLRVAKPGGYVVHTTCFLTPYHGPGDFWRYTPEGLRLLCKDNASEIIEAGSWGNPLTPWGSFLGFGWQNVPKAKWHPFHWLSTWNWPSYAWVVWVIARK